MKRSYNKLIWKEVVWQRPFQIESVTDLLTQLSGLTRRKQMVWEIRGQKDVVRYYLGMDESDLQHLEKLFNAHGQVEFSSSSTCKRQPTTHCKLLKITGRQSSLKVKDHEAITRASLAVMSRLGPKEELVLQIIIGSSSPPRAIPNKLPDPNSTWFDLLTGNIQPASSETRQLIKDKFSFHQFNTVIRLGAHSASPARNIFLVQELLSGLRIIESTGAKLSLKSECNIKMDEARTPWCYPLALSVPELAKFLLLPTGEEELPGIRNQLHPKLILPPNWINTSPDKKDRRVFGTTLSGGSSGEKKLLSISPKDSLEHCIIHGPTGSGKTNVLLSQILEDIKAGRSTLVIDPKTDLVNDILARIPDNRRQDVVILDPSSPSPVGFNPFALTSHGQSPELIADAILAVMKDVFSENWGIRSRDVLSSSLLTLARLKNTSLVMLPPLLTNKAFRQKLLKDLHDPLGLEPFWNWYELLSEGERSQLIAPVLNKIRQFLLRPQLRNVLGQTEPKFSLTDLFYKRKIILIPLNKGVIGAETAELLGSLIVGLTWTFALSRGKLPPEKRHIINLYIDELQDYLRLPTDLSDALSMARGLGISLTLAHQYRHQLPPNLKAGIDANCKNKIIFGLNMGDAKEMASQTNELEPIDFNLLPRYHVYTNLLHKGKSSGWMSGRTNPPSPITQDIAEIYAESMARYGRPSNEIERENLDILGYPDERENPKTRTSIKDLANEDVIKNNANSTSSIGKKKR